MDAGPVNVPSAPPPRGPVMRLIAKNPWVFFFVVGVVILTSLKFCENKQLSGLPVLGTLPAFSLTDQDGQAFGSADLRGKVWIASFIFTTCQTVCRDVSGSNGRIQGALEGQRDDILLVSFTVDPEYDQPDVLKQYGQRYQAKFDRWKFLTGPRDALFPLITEGFQAAMGDKGPNKAGVVDITHSTKLVLVDKLGRVRHYFSSQSEEERSLVVAHALKLAQEPMEEETP